MIGSFSRRRSLQLKKKTRAGGAHHPCKETHLREGKLEPNPSSPPKTEYISPRAGSKSGIYAFSQQMIEV